MRRRARSNLRSTDARLKKRHVAAARSESPWDLSNRVLYDLCQRHPLHVRQDEVLAKVLLIGRVYAAAIERGTTKTEKNEAFYLRTVAPKIMGSKIDTWIRDARAVTPGTPEGTSVLLATHYRVTKLFNRIRGQDKRSLASKYLHFHVPNLFFIFDSRARKGMSAVTGIVDRPNPVDTTCDDQYRKFVQKCLSLRKHCKQEFDWELSPRQLDKLLLLLSPQ